MSAKNEEKQFKTINKYLGASTTERLLCLYVCVNVLFSVYSKFITKSKYSCIYMLAGKRNVESEIVRKRNHSEAP